MADGYLARMNDCFRSQLNLVNSIASALTSTSKGLALYLGRFFLQPLSHIDMVQLNQTIILCLKVFLEMISLSQRL